MNGIVDVCISARQPGWATIGKDLIVALWPKGSEMDTIFGPDADSTNLTEGDDSRTTGDSPETGTRTHLERKLRLTKAVAR